MFQSHYSAPPIPSWHRIDSYSVALYQGMDGYTTCECGQACPLDDVVGERYTRFINYGTSMSGHSKWNKIRHKKGAADAKRGDLFTKLCAAITVAVKTGGGDPEMNFSLRMAIDKAKDGNVPKDNIDRAIKRGTGESKDAAEIQELLYEGYGPGGVAVLIETLTDNPNRTVSNVKHAFSKYGGSMARPGSVKWQFERLGVVRLDNNQREMIDDQDSFELSLMDAVAEDIVSDEHSMEIRCQVTAFQNVLESVYFQGIREPADAGLQWVAKEEVPADESTASKIQTLFDVLHELDDVKEVYTNES